MSNDLIGLANETFSNLPDPVRASAFQAINRLVGSAASIPEAYLRRWAQKVNSKTDAEAEVWRRLSGKVSDRVADDEAMMDRATTTLLGDSFRKQANREAVAVEAVRLLSNNSSTNGNSSNDAQAPSDDWMNVFVEYAERASSEALQNIWAKVLCGEIRKPKEFSLSTMRFISQLDQSIAKLFESVSQDFVFDFALKDQSVPNQDISDFLSLEEAGILNGASGMLSKVFKVAENGFLQYGHMSNNTGGCLLVAKAAAGRIVNVPAHILTRTGREILKLLPERDPYIALRPIANFLSTQSFERVELIRIVPTPTGSMLQFPEVIFPKT